MGWPKGKKRGPPNSEVREFHCWGDGVNSFRFAKRRAGALLDGKEHKAFPEACR